jgi:acyl-coenzyme A thioesterase PaaI-like protein
MTLPPELQGFEPMPGAGFNGYFGTILWDPRKASGDEKQFAIMPEAKHLNGGGALHGGFLMTVVDNVLGTVAHAPIPDKVASTVSLNTDFLSGGTLDGPVYGQARITRQTRSLLFVAGELTQNGRLLMTASGIWKIIGA